MPTDVRIQGITCRLDTEQDPEVWTCDYRFQEVVSGLIVPASIENEIDTDPNDAMGVWLEDEEYVLV